MATVRRCIDCDVVLTDDVPAAAADGEAVGSTAAPVGRGDQVGYELEGWGNQLKESLDGMLVKAGIGRVWEAGALVVAAVDEERVDDLIATIEGDDLPELADDTPRVALEIEGLDAEGHVELDARLLASSVPHAWDDEGDLIVAEADEEQVLAIIEQVLDGPADEADGLAAQNALSALYVAVDRLAKNPHDRKLATAYVRAADGVDDLPVPYGFATEDWDDLVAEVEQLATAVVPHADVVAPTPADDGSADDPDGDEVADGDEAAEPEATDEAEAPGDGGDASQETAADDPDDDEDPDDADPDDADDEPDDDHDQGVSDDDELPAELSSVDGARAAARALRERLVDLV